MCRDDKAGTTRVTDEVSVRTCSYGEATGAGSLRNDGTRAQRDWAGTRERVGHVTTDARRVSCERVKSTCKKWITFRKVKLFTELFAASRETRRHLDGISTA